MNRQAWVKARRDITGKFYLKVWLIDIAIIDGDIA
jgi:hypothetical protein